MRRALRLLPALCALLLATLAASPAHAQGDDPILVTEVSQGTIRVRQGFTGTQLLVFGAILDPRGGRAESDYDIAVILRGPSQAIQLREKDRLEWLGIWVNAESASFRSVPSFFALASSAPIDALVDPQTAAIYELGLDYLQLSPTGSIDPAEQVRMTSGLVDLKQRQQLFQQAEDGVSITEGVLYQARIDIPSNVIIGNYTAETLAIRDGRVIASGTAQVEVVKEGFERVVADEAEEHGLFYGLFAVGLSLLMGWAAGRLYALV